MRNVFLRLQFFFREPDGQAARQQAQRVNSGSLRIQHARGRRPVHGVAVVIEIGQNEHEKENTFGNQKADDAHAVFFQNESVPRGCAADDWIGIFRMRQIPQRSPAADWRHAVKIMRGRRRGRGPFQRPRLPRIVTRRFAVAQAHDNIPQQTPAPTRRAKTRRWWKSDSANPSPADRDKYKRAAPCPSDRENVARKTRC